MSKFEEMLGRAVPVSKYIASLSSADRPKFEERGKSYKPKMEVLKSLRKIAKDFIAVVICSSWCKDCITHTPVLEIIHKRTGLRVEVLGGVKTDPLNPKRLWAVPPSPPEVDTLKITRIPTILVYSLDGKEVGRIIEHPQIKPTLEEELLYIMTRTTS
ncbi:MAG: TlpA family protein disulfide reductase [Promethearchaeota archaeon]